MRIDRANIFVHLIISLQEEKSDKRMTAKPVVTVNTLACLTSDIFRVKDISTYICTKTVGITFTNGTKIRRTTTAWSEQCVAIEEPNYSEADKLGVEFQHSTPTKNLVPDPQTIICNRRLGCGSGKKPEKSNYSEADKRGGQALARQSPGTVSNK